MGLVPFQLLTCLWFIILQSVNADVRYVQFYRNEAALGASISTTLLDNGTQLLMQISASTSYTWAGIGSHSKMANSIMFIIYPSTNGKSVKFSLRSTTEHYAPTALPDKILNVYMTSSQITNGRMIANIVWNDPKLTMGSQALPGRESVDIASEQQAFIWAVGPSTSESHPINADDASAPLSKHSNHGVVFVDMTASQNPPDDIRPPQVSGTSSTSSVKPQPYYYHTLVAVHTIALTVAFVLIFPFGFIGLRVNTRNKQLAIKIHWILQTIACAAVIVGFPVAIAMSILGVQYSSLTTPHQLIAMAACILVAFQSWLGRAHALRFKIYNKRTVFSYIHFVLGRLVIWAGITAAVLGFILTGRGSPVVITIAVGSGLMVVSEFFAIRNWIKTAKQKRVTISSEGYDMGGSYQKLKDVTANDHTLDEEVIKRYSTLSPVDTH